MKDGQNSKAACVFCDIVMYEAMPGSLKNYQPDGGGEVIFSFGYGSVKFDRFIGGTQFRGLVCDECAAKFTGKMDMNGFGPGWGAAAE